MRLRKKKLGILLAFCCFFLVFYKFPTNQIDLLEEIIADEEVNADNPELTRSAIILKMQQINFQQQIYNEDQYGPVQSNSTIILIQVHDRLVYLQHLIESLSNVKGISTTLLIFSHDYYSKPINEIVQNIKFAKVMQIFFPYGLQLYPFEFPGDDMLDCAKTQSKNRFPKCAGSYDSFGNIRKAAITQIKHHWWWNWNIVFDTLNVTKHYTGLVLYMEEDNYVVEDMLYVLDQMIVERQQYDEVNVFAVGKKWNARYYEFPNNEYYIRKWEMGNIAMNKTTWHKIKKCATEFCRYDDYNWDWTLLSSVSKCYPLIAMNLKFPKIFHIGVQGVHNTNMKYTLSQALSRIKGYVDGHRQYLFPKKIHFSPKQLLLTNMDKYGGWGDKRDHELCMKMTN